MIFLCDGFRYSLNPTCWSQQVWGESISGSAWIHPQCRDKCHSCSWVQGLLTRWGHDGEYTDLVLASRSVLSNQHLRSLLGAGQGLIQVGFSAYSLLVNWCTAGAQYGFGGQISPCSQEQDPHRLGLFSFCPSCTCVCMPRSTWAHMHTLTHRLTHLGAGFLLFWGMQCHLSSHSQP